MKPALAESWARAGCSVSPQEVAEVHERAGVRILLPEDPSYPELLASDVEPPAVIFALGDLSALEARRVAIVGTRRCTGVGAGVARELGRELSTAGVAVVSGLALGIDGAAHRGALDAVPGGAAPVGVVGSGLDVVYPSRHRELWEAVARRGLLLSEAPLGARPTGWRFPARNRVIAALAEVVVVAESHARGGSMHTVEEAQRREIPVMAVPGSVRSPASRGVNELIADGCHPVCDTADVLVALGLSSTRRARSQADSRPAPTPPAAAVLDAMGWDPATLEHLVVRTSLRLPDLSLALEELVSGGWLALDGGWYERVASS